jgi:uncharacterized membrane protein YbhN (UPF0104 family)
MPAAFAAMPRLRAIAAGHADSADPRRPSGFLTHVKRWLTSHHLDHSRRQLALSVIAAALLALGGLAGVCWVAGFGALGHELRHISWPWYVAALGAEAVAYVGYTLAYRALAHIDEGASVRLPRAFAAVASGFGLFIPRGGFAADYRAFVEMGLRPHEARLRVLGLSALEYAVLAPATSIAAIYLLARGMALYWIADFGCLWVCLRAVLGHSTPVAALLVGYATGYALTRRTLPFAGAGAVEVLLPFSLYWVGIPLAPAVLAVLAYRIMNLWIPLLPALAGRSRLRLEA